MHSPKPQKKPPFHKRLEEMFKRLKKKEALALFREIRKIKPELAEEIEKEPLFQLYLNLRMFDLDVQEIRARTKTYFPRLIPSDIWEELVAPLMECIEEATINIVKAHQYLAQLIRVASCVMWVKEKRVDVELEKKYEKLMLLAPLQPWLLYRIIPSERADEVMEEILEIGERVTDWIEINYPECLEEKEKS